MSAHKITELHIILYATEFLYIGIFKADIQYYIEIIGVEI